MSKIARAFAIALLFAAGTAATAGQHTGTTTAADDRPASVPTTASQCMAC